MGFNPLIYKHLEQWVKTHWTMNAEIVKEPSFFYKKAIIIQNEL
jgi:hypothetical protein